MAKEEFPYEDRPLDGYVPDADEDEVDPFLANGVPENEATGDAQDAAAQVTNAKAESPDAPEPDVPKGGTDELKDDDAADPREDTDEPEGDADYAFEEDESDDDEDELAYGEEGYDAADAPAAEAEASAVREVPEGRGESAYVRASLEPERQAQAAMRMAPNSRLAEKGLISSLMHDPGQIASIAAMLKPDDFYYSVYRILYKTLVSMNEDGKQIDLTLLHEELRHAGKGAEQITITELAEIDQSEATAAFARDYAKIVADKAMLRSILKTNEAIAKDCYAQEKSSEKILEQAESGIFALSQQITGEHKDQHIQEIVLDTIGDIEKAAKADSDVTGIASGFADLDEKLSGFQPSDFILIAARPSMGKTAFVLNIADYVSRNHITTAVFSLEMSRKQLVNRLLSLESGVEAEKLRKGNLNSQDWMDLIEGGERVGRSSLIIDDTPGISVGQLRSKCQKYKMEQGLGLVIIDYLQLMSGSGRTDSRQQEISEISRSLKALARDLNVPIITLSQLSRAVEQRPDHRPILSDLRESGAIEQDADVVMFIYRDDYYNKDTDEKNIAEINIAKQRNGPIGTIKLAWIAEQTKFANLEKRRGNYH